MLEYSEIIPGRLWVGAYVREDEVEELKQIGITTVVCMQTDEDLHYYGISPEALARAYSRAGIEFQRQPIRDFDRAALASDLPAAVARVEAALAGPDIRVYLHCTAGAIRSATTAAGYLIRSRRISAYDACAFLISRRNCNPTLDVLENYEMTLASASHE